MSEISVGSAVGAGFQLIGRRPLSVLLWGLLRVGFVAAFLAIYLPLFFGFFVQAAQAGANGGGQASPAIAMQMMSRVMMMQGVGLLLQLVGLLLNAVICCAIIRAVLHPQKRAFGSLRLGAPELYFVLLSFAFGIVLAIALPIVLVPFLIVVGLLGANHQWVAMGVTIGLGMIVLMLAAILVALRFAFVAPMMVDDGKFHLFESWALTKGRVGSLFAIGLVLAAMGILIMAVLGAIFAVLCLGALMAVAGGFANIPAFFQAHAQNPQSVVPLLAPPLILAALLAIPIEGAMLAIFIAPWARAYRDVMPTTPLAAPAMPPSAAPLASAP